MTLNSPTLGSGLTVLLAEGGCAVELNPVAAALIGRLCWVGADVLILTVEVLVICGSGWLRRWCPTISLAGAWSIATLGVLGVACNLWIFGSVEILSVRHLS